MSRRPPVMRRPMFRIGKDEAKLVRRADLERLLATVGKAVDLIDDDVSALLGRGYAAELRTRFEASLKPFAGGLDLYSAVAEPQLKGALADDQGSKVEREAEGPAR